MKGSVVFVDAGPKLYVKPSQKSNRSIIVNAISHCCLAGVVNRAVKDKVLEASWQFPLDIDESYDKLRSL